MIQESLLLQSQQVLSPDGPALELISLLRNCLPSRRQATSLCEIYLQQLTLFIRPVQRGQLYMEVLPLAYECNVSSDGVCRLPTKTDNISHLLQTLGLLFAILAVATVCVSVHPVAEGEIP